MHNESSQKFLDSNLADLLSVKIELSQNKIRLSDAPQEFAAKITISENKLEYLEVLLKKEEATSATLDIICVIDRSGSMYGRKMAEVKKSLKQLLEILKPTDRISLIVFDDRSQIIMSPKLIGKSKQIILDTIDKIVVREETNIAKGIADAYKVMLKRKTKNQITGIILLGDGKDNCLFSDKSNIDEFFDNWDPNIKNEEYSLHTFGYGKAHDGELMDKISKKCGGNFYYVQDIEKVG
jgi:Mg-chelatase subunit ChlD